MRATRGGQDVGRSTCVRDLPFYFSSLSLVVFRSMIVALVVNDFSTLIKSTSNNYITSQSHENFKMNSDPCSSISGSRFRVAVLIY